MNAEFDSFEDLINNKDTIKHFNSFDLSQLKIEHFYCFDDPKSGDPFSTSIELNFNYDENNNINVTKTVYHTYASIHDSSLLTTDSYSILIEDGYILLEQLSKLDLTELKNNYYTDFPPDNLTHWELSYNYIFKVCGTYNQKIEEFSTISTILNLKGVIKDENNKIKNRISEFSGDVL